MFGADSPCDKLFTLLLISPISKMAAFMHDIAVTTAMALPPQEAGMIDNPFTPEQMRAFFWKRCLEGRASKVK